MTWDPWTDTDLPPEVRLRIAEAEAEATRFLQQKLRAQGFEDPEQYRAELWITAPDIDRPPPVDDEAAALRDEAFRRFEAGVFGEESDE